MSTTNIRVAGFDPTKHGFKFKNTFLWADLVKHPLLSKLLTDKTGSIGYGLCGGMAHTVHEMWKDKKPMFTTKKAPSITDPLYYYIVEGLLESFGNKNQYLKKTLEWHQLPSAEQLKRTGPELLALKLLLSRGEPVQLYLMYEAGGSGNVWNNHQVLAFGLEQDNNGNGKILCYDPNFPEKTTFLEYTSNRLVVTSLNQPGISYTLHGFFVARVRIDDLDTKLTYLASTGWTTFIQTAVNNLRLSIDSIVSIMKDWYDLSPREVVNELKLAGVSALKAGFAVMKVFKSAADAVATLLNLAGFGLASLIEFLGQAFGSVLNRIGDCLRKLGYKVADIARDMIQVLKRSGEAVLRWFKTVYATAAELGNLMKNVMKLTAVEAARLLKKLAFRFEDFILVLVNDFKCSALDLAKNIQREYNKSALELLKILRKHYGLDWVKYAKLLFFDLNYSFDSVFNAIKNQFSIGLLEFTKVLK